MNLSKREKVLLCLLTFVVVIGSYINFLILPKLEAIKETKTTLKEKTIELNSLQQARKSDSLNKTEKQLQEEIDKVEEAIPSQIKIPRVYLDILSIVEKTGVQQESLNMQTASLEGETSQEGEEAKQNIQDKSEQLLIIPIVHKIRGTYGEIEDYIDSIQKCGRKIDIIEYEIINSKEDKNNHQLSASFMLKAYGLVKQGQNYSEFVDYKFLKDNYGRPNPFQPNSTAKDNDAQDVEEQE
ncbi:hypothetical protein NSA47_03130 [Irregularibacter muris]|uniref:Pilus assembly protein PilO n=1 Tax=Irregularibacter muris TaxID=1796619 RepID=A0AAE3HCY7_9FIRM|nr:type 4a pilus biogenesis protein PilO [Irregularibacter muris]MCR1897981.1 hypothetical protein [Irregularibacter muris]